MWFSDLHTHSTASDGSTPPEVLPFLAREAGLRAIALTDHNTVAGLDAFTRAGKEAGILTVRGTELTAGYGDIEVHLAALFLHPDRMKPIHVFNKIRAAAKAANNLECTERLAEAGYPISYKELASRFDGTSINRVHIANILMEKGCVASVREAFDTLLYPGGPFYHEPPHENVFDAIGTVIEAGGVPVIAHPLLNLSPEQLWEFLPRAAEAGLAGIETHYSTYTPQQQELALRAAKEFGLIGSGGSDFHGKNKPTISLGDGGADEEAFFALMEKAAK